MLVITTTAPFKSIFTMSAASYSPEQSRCVEVCWAPATNARRFICYGTCASPISQALATLVLSIRLSPIPLSHVGDESAQQRTAATPPNIGVHVWIVSRPKPTVVATSPDVHIFDACEDASEDAVQTGCDVSKLQPCCCNIIVLFRSSKPKISFSVHSRAPTPMHSLAASKNVRFEWQKPCIASASLQVYTSPLSSREGVRAHPSSTQLSMLEVG